MVIELSQVFIVVDCARDALRRDVRRLKRNATVIERTTIEDRRRRLEARINTFHARGDTLMVGVDVDDVGPSMEKEHDKWDDREELAREVDDDEATDRLSGSELSSDHEGVTARQPDEDEEDEDMEYAEHLSLCMPSSWGRQALDDAGLKMLGLQEIELRVGQANDALGDLRVELGHKALLFRTKVRNTKNTKGKTKAWKEVNKSSMDVMKHVRRYERARGALIKLGVENGILQMYQEIKKEDLKMSADILEENRFGQKNTTMAWFWRLGPQGDNVGNEWMEECEYIGKGVVELVLTKKQFIE